MLEIWANATPPLRIRNNSNVRLLIRPSTASMRRIPVDGGVEKRLHGKRRDTPAAEHKALEIEIRSLRSYVGIVGSSAIAIGRHAALEPFRNDITIRLLGTNTRPADKPQAQTMSRLAWTMLY